MIHEFPTVPIELENHLRHTLISLINQIAAAKTVHLPNSTISNPMLSMPAQQSENIAFDTKIDSKKFGKTSFASNSKSSHAESSKKSKLSLLSEVSGSDYSDTESSSSTEDDEDDIKSSSTEDFSTDTDDSLAKQTFQHSSSGAPRIYTSDIHKERSELSQYTTISNKQLKTPTHPNGVLIHQSVTQRQILHMTNFDSALYSENKYEEFESKIKSGNNPENSVSIIADDDLVDESDGSVSEESI